MIKPMTAHVLRYRFMLIFKFIILLFGILSITPEDGYSSQVLVAQGGNPFLEQPSKDRQKKVRKGRKKRKKRKAPNLEPSERQRKSKSFGIGIGGGNIFGGIYGGRGELSLNLSEKSQIVATGGYGQLDVADDNSDQSIVQTYEASAEMYNGSMGINYFITNSFAIGAGVGFRNVTLILGFEATLNPELFEEYTITSNIFYGYIEISNMWIFDSGFYIRPTWFGMQSTLSASSESEVNGEFGEDTEYEKETLQAAEGLQKVNEGSGAHILISVGFLL